MTHLVAPSKSTCSPTLHCTLFSCQEVGMTRAIIPTELSPDQARQRGRPPLPLHGLQVQDYYLVVRSSVGTATGIWVALIGPPGEVPGGVLVVISASPQRKERLVINKD